MLSSLATAGVAFFPKCPVCWTAYMSAFGITGLERIEYSPSLLPLLASVMLISLMSVWWRARSTGRMSGFYLVCAGVLAVVASRLGLAPGYAASVGVGLTLLGSIVSTLSSEKSKIFGISSPASGLNHR